jgi:hypothetical protein
MNYCVPIDVNYITLSLGVMILVVITAYKQGRIDEKKLHSTEPNIHENKASQGS